MKKLVSMWLGLAVLLSLSVTVFATESEQEQTDATMCSHSWVEGTSIASTCTAEGEKNFTCSLCNETKKETIPIDSTAHSWGNGNIIIQPSCTAEGERVYTCACGESKRESISKVSHDFYPWAKVDASTHERSCKNCTDKESGNHSWEEKVNKEATCQEDGSKKKTCTLCGTSEIIVIPKLTTHTYDNVCDADCNVCGEKRNTSHTYGSSWSRDHSGHWNECTKCGEKKDFRAHYPGPAATEEQPQVCLTCDYVIAAQKEHQHSYGKKWTQHDSGHWYTCATCDAKKDYAQHIYDSVCDENCNICDYKNPSAHDYDNIMENDEKKHWSVCRVCKTKSEAELHIPGSEATDTQPQLCTICGYEIKPIQAHVHAFGPAWMYDGKTHWQACLCGEQTVPSIHTWSEGVKNKDKTVTYLCTQCQAEKMEDPSGFPWWIIALFFVLAAGGGAAVYIFYIVPKKQVGKFVA